MIKIALNGGTPVSVNPNVPTTVEEYAKELSYFVEAGLKYFHIFTWDVIKYCREYGLDWRIGMEDIACDMDGNAIATNRQLYEYAISL